MIVQSCQMTLDSGYDYKSTRTFWIHARPRRASIHVRLVALWSNHVIPLKLCAVCVRAALALVCAVSVTFALLYFMSCCFCCLRNECIEMVRILCFDSPCLLKVWTTLHLRLCGCLFTFSAVLSAGDINRWNLKVWSRSFELYFTLQPSISCMLYSKFELRATNC